MKTDMTLDEKIEASKLKIKEMQRAGARPKCRDCVWQHITTKGLKQCRQPLVADAKVESVTGRPEYKIVSCDAARLGLCGPNGDLFTEKNFKEKLVAQKDSLVTFLIVLFGIAVVGLIAGGIVWLLAMFGAGPFFIGVFVLSIVIMFFRVMFLD